MNQNAPAGWEQLAVTEEHHYKHTNHKQETPSMLVKGNNKDFELCPAGSHVARCYRIVDMGTQVGNFQGKETHNRMILISWELPHAKMEDDRPFSCARSFNMTLGKKSNLRGMMKSWRGRDFTDEELGGFDISNFIGKPCLVNIVHKHVPEKETTYANVEAVMPLPQGTECPMPVNPTVLLDMNNFNKEVFDGLSDNLQQRIVQSPEYAVAMGYEAAPQKEQGNQPPPDTSGPPGENPPPNYDVKEAAGDFDDDVPF